MKFVKGEKVSIIGLRSFHLGMRPEEKGCFRAIRTAIDAGINFIGNCWDHNEGNSEIRMAKALRNDYRLSYHNLLASAHSGKILFRLEVPRLN